MTLLLAAVTAGALEIGAVAPEFSMTTLSGKRFSLAETEKSHSADLMDARRTPEALLFDSSGTLRYHGRIASKLSAPDLKTAIEALLDGKPIRPAETKAFGCAIARR